MAQGFLLDYQSGFTQGTLASGSMAWPWSVCASIRARAAAVPAAGGA
ncbi:OprD family porin [Pseudomonas bharatica]